MTALLVCVLTKTWKDRKRMGMNKKMTEHTETYKLYCTTLRTLTFNWNEPTRMREEKKQPSSTCYAMQTSMWSLWMATRAHLIHFFSSYVPLLRTCFFPSSFNILLTLALLLHVHRLHLFTCHIRMSTVAHFFHSSFSICLVFFLLIFLLTQSKKKRNNVFQKPKEIIVKSGNIVSQII